MSSDDSDLSDSDIELQEAFADGKLKPGLNKIEGAPKQFVNNVSGLKQKLEEIKLDLPWLERLDCINSQAPLAPEIAAKIHTLEQKRENQLRNNKKLSQYKPNDDPLLNEFEREMMFHRQAQATVVDAFSKLKAMGIPTKRPDDFFAEMAKTDDHMQKIRDNLMKKEEQQKRSERVKQLRQQRKEGKMLQIQTKLQRQHEKKEMLNQVKKVRKGMSKDLDFLDGRKNNTSRKAIEKRNMKDKKFGFGGKKRGMKQNNKDSSADISEFRSPGKPSKKLRKGNLKNKKHGGNKGRPGKSSRVKNKARAKK